MALRGLGMGAMLHILAGGSERSASEYVGRRIVAADLKEERLTLAFEDGAEIAIYDDGQSCCEARYMRTDDDVSSLVGKVLTRIETRDAPDETDDPDGYGEVHEVCFVEVGTDDGFVTIANHNEHNGYYGGFGLTIVQTKAPPA